MVSSMEEGPPEGQDQMMCSVVQNFFPGRDARCKCVVSLKSGCVYS